MVKYPKIGIKFVKNRVKLEIGVKTDSLTVLVLHILPKLMILVSGIWFQVSSILHSIIRLQISLSQIPTLHILPLKNYGLYFGARSKLIHFLWKCAHNRIRMWQELFFFFFSLIPHPLIKIAPNIYLETVVGLKKLSWV